VLIDYVMVIVGGLYYVLLVEMDFVWVCCFFDVYLMLFLYVVCNVVGKFWFVGMLLFVGGIGVCRLVVGLVFMLVVYVGFFVFVVGLVLELVLVCVNLIVFGFVDMFLLVLFFGDWFDVCCDELCIIFFVGCMVGLDDVVVFGVYLFVNMVFIGVIYDIDGG